MTFTRPRPGAAGDSAVIEAFGLGAMAIELSPAQMASLGESLPNNSRQRSAELSVGPHPCFRDLNIKLGATARAAVKLGSGPVVGLGILDKLGEARTHRRRYLRYAHRTLPDGHGQTEHVTDLNPMTAVEIARRIRAGETTPSAVMTACLARIAEREPDVGAFIHLDAERAMERAEVADRLPPKDGFTVCPLR